MAADRYVKFILTVIALELLWLGAREAAPPVQAQPAPMPVVVTGFRFGGQDFNTVPVAVVGGLRANPGRELPGVETLRVAFAEPVRLDTKEPVTVRTGVNPLIVEVVPAKPSARPGH